MTLAITGSSGFIGTNFIKQVHGFQIIEIDLLSQKVENIDFTGVDAVLHLAALVHQMKVAPEEQYFKINRDLAFELAQKAKKQGVKHFIFMSTSKVYGESTTGKEAWNETSLCNPVDPYGKSKMEAEKLILGLQDADFKVAVVRSPLVYDIGVKANMYNLIKLIDSFSVLPLGNIQNRRSMVYVGNLIALQEHIIKNKESGIFIAGDQTPLSTTSLCMLIAKSFSKKITLFSIPSIFRQLASIIKPSIVERLFGSLELDNSKTNLKLKFIPPYSTEQGINEMVQWYKSNKTKK